MSYILIENSKVIGRGTKDGLEEWVNNEGGQDCEYLICKVVEEWPAHTQEYIELEEKILG